MSKLPATILKTIKFGLVGLSGLVIDFSLTWLLKEKLRINRYVANSCGFSIAVINNFFWNKVWTFQSQHNWKNELLLFAGIAIVGLILNNSFLFFFHEKLRLKFYTGKFISIVCVFVWNFLANFYFNFK